MKSSLFLLFSRVDMTRAVAFATALFFTDVQISYRNP